MKYENIILESFKKFNLSPREGQVDIINKILIEFLDNKIQNVILNAPTGTGKSIIQYITAECLATIDNNPLGSITLTATNTLSNQYYENFGKNKDYIMIKGANNYNCGALSTFKEKESAESCMNYNFKKLADINPAINEKIINHCNKCDYLRIKQHKNRIRHLTTNYSYYFIDRLYISTISEDAAFENRSLVTFDEAHLINDIFCDHCSIFVSSKRFTEIVKELNSLTDKILSLNDIKVIGKLSNMIKDSNVGESNYKSYIKLVAEVYTGIKNKASAIADEYLKSGNFDMYKKYYSIMNKYYSLCCKIGDFFTYNFEHTFEYNEMEESITIKPLFANSVFNKKLHCGPRNLFMSATINEDFLIETTGIENSKFIKVEPIFPKENKIVIFYNNQNLNFKSLQDKTIIDTVCQNVEDIVKVHIENNDRGIILTPSFKIQEEIVKRLSKLDKNGKITLYEHKQGTKLEPLLKQYKKDTSKNCILISPAMYEGVDLPGDLSRFQILVKAPFPSLGDKRMKYILEKYPHIYNLLTITKMVQGAGRSVRTPDDFAITYMLDSNAYRLFSSHQNIWKNEFDLHKLKSFNNI